MTTIFIYFIWKRHAVVVNLSQKHLIPIDNYLFLLLAISKYLIRVLFCFLLLQPAVSRGPCPSTRQLH